ncbi:MAG: FliG C-terminal domain-containing protein [Phycisphaerae bacterium]
MSRRTRILIALAALLAGCGGLWLALAGGQVQFVPVLNEPFDEADLSTAVALLESRGIAARAVDGKLMTRPNAVGQSRSILAYEGLLPRNMSSAFEEIARETDVWSTSDRNDKRWQAAKMTALGRLIGSFPPVRSATVLFEPGSPRGLGSAAVEPTASVKVALKPNCSMDRKLVAAIADLVSGSISGMRRQNVHVVDGAGRSYRVGEDGALSADERFEQIKAAEAFYREKVRGAIQYIDNAIVGIRVEGEGPAMRCVSASVSVPRAYLAAIYRTSHPDTHDVTDEALNPVIEPQLTRIKQAVMRTIGADDPSVVTVDWFYDFAAGGGAAHVPAAGRAASGWPLSAGWTHAAGWGLGGLCLVMGLVLLWLRRMRSRRTMAGDAGQMAPADGDNTSVDGLSGGHGEANPFAFFCGVPDGQVVEFLNGEHPQTVAMILAALPPAKSAAILSALGADRQVETARRIAALDGIDPQVAQDVARGVAQRFSQAVRDDRPSGLAIVARILQQAGGAVEQSVLDGLSSDEPALAESIRRRMPAFEDIAMMPQARLRETLEHFDSDELAVALRTAADEIKDRVLSSLSPEAAGRIREEMERGEPVRLSDVEAAQQNVAQALRRSGGQYVPAAERDSGVLA